MLHWSELSNFARLYLNRPQAALQEDAFWSLYEGGRPSGRARLLCVITTYNRPAACQDVLTALRGALAGADAFLLVLNDRSDSDYAGVRAHAAELFGERMLWLDARARMGKPGFWKAYQVAFLVARALQPEHALFVQDDLAFAPTLLTSIRAQWEATAGDPLRRVLYLFSSAEDERFGRWVLAPRRDVGHGLRRTQWFDLQAFFVDRAFFELLSYRMIPIHENRWRRKPRISSGVGKQLTLRLFRRANVYQSYPPLVFHGGCESQMNPDARAKRALDNRGLAQTSGASTSKRESGDR
ncbi:MAG TPA: hypothetical protein VI299_25330 [Polyangiales bacterium]